MGGEATSDGGVIREKNQQRKEWQKAKQQDWVEDGPSPSSTGMKGDGGEQ